VVLRIGFNPTRSTSPCYNTTKYTCMQCTQSNTHTKMNLSTVKWAQWDKTQSRELLVCSYVCALHCAQLLHTILHRTDLIISHLTLQTVMLKQTTNQLPHWRTSSNINRKNGSEKQPRATGNRDDNDGNTPRRPATEKNVQRSNHSGCRWWMKKRWGEPAILHSLGVGVLSFLLLADPTRPFPFNWSEVSRV